MNGYKKPDDTIKRSKIYFALAAAMVAEAVYGFLALLWTLIQPSSLAPWGIVLSFTIVMGLLWAVLVYQVYFKGAKYSSLQMDNLSDFIAYYTAVYIITVAWGWGYIDINYRNNTQTSSPKSDEDAFMGNMSFCIIQVFFSFLFQLKAYRVISTSENNTNGPKAIFQIEKDGYHATNASFRTFSIICHLLGMAYASSYFFYMMGYPMSTLNAQMFLFVGFSVAYAIQLMLYWTLRSAYERQKSAAGVRQYNWYDSLWIEIGTAQFFLLAFFVYNVLVWIVLWSDDSVEFSNRYKFDNRKGRYYTYIAASIGNSALIGWHPFFLVTSICNIEWIVQDSSSVNYTATIIGPTRILTMLFSPFRALLTVTYKGSRKEFGNQSLSGMRLVLGIVYSMGMAFQFAGLCLSIATAINTKLLATVWFNWQYTFLIVGSAMIIIYGIDIIMRVIKSQEHSDGIREMNMITFCAIARPLIVYIVCVFFLSFGYMELYREEGGNRKLSQTLVNDYTQYAWVVYWSLITASIGIFFTLFLATIDMIDSLTSGANTVVTDVSQITYKELDSKSNA